MHRAWFQWVILGLFGCNESDSMVVAPSSSTPEWHLITYQITNGKPGAPTETLTVNCNAYQVTFYRPLNQLDKNLNSMTAALKRDDCKQALTLASSAKLCRSTTDNEASLLDGNQYAVQCANHEEKVAGYWYAHQAPDPHFHQYTRDLIKRYFPGQYHNP